MAQVFMFYVHVRILIGSCDYGNCMRRTLILRLDYRVHTTAHKQSILTAFFPPTEYFAVHAQANLARIRSRYLSVG